MTTATTSIPFTTPPTSGPSLEALVDRLVDSIFGSALGTAGQSLARTVHDARRQRKAGDLDGALSLLASADLAGATEQETRWAYGEWLGIARRRFGDREGAVVYSPGRGRAAVLAPCGDAGTLEVLAVLGMCWQSGKLVSRRSLRGLRPLAGGS